MALNKKIVEENGVILAYHRITAFHYNVEEEKITLYISRYVDEDIRRKGENNLKNKYDTEYITFPYPKDKEITLAELYKLLSKDKVYEGSKFI